MSLDFTGQIVLVTGASRGIGLAVAAAFARCGASVHALAETEAVVAAAEAIHAVGHIVDITDQAALARMTKAIGVLDVLVNNAGLERMTPLDDASAESLAVFRRVLDVNVIGTYLVTKAALALMREGGRIINTASTWGRVAEPLFGAYVASKHAVIGLTKTWARELGPRGIRVNAVAPGWTRTEGALRSLRTLSERHGKDEASLLEDILAGQALPGLMNPDDVTGPYLYLASSLASNVTGQTLGVDRGEVPW